MDEIQIKLNTFEKVDLRSEAYRNYLEKAAAYDTDDYTYTYHEDVVFFQNPVRISWELSGITRKEIEKTSVLISAREDFFLAEELFQNVTPEQESDAGSSGTEDPEELYRRIDIDNLMPGRKYYYKVRLQLLGKGILESETASFETYGLPRILKIDGVRNFRDIGGKPAYNGRRTCFNKVFRSAQLGGITEAGLSEIAKLNIKTELDLRNDTDIQNALLETENREIIGASAAGIPNYLHWNGNGTWMLYHKTGAVTNKFFENIENTSRNLRLFTDSSVYPILIHCVGGADRTGTICAFLEMLCGVSENDVAIDYETTNHRYRTESVFPKLGMTMYYARFIAYIKEFPGKDLMEKTGYIAKTMFGLNDEEIKAIRENLTEETKEN